MQSINRILKKARRKLLHRLRPLEYAHRRGVSFPDGGLIAGAAAMSSFIAGDPIVSSAAAAVASLGIIGSVAAESMRAMDSWKITYAEEYTKRIGS